MNVPKDYQDCYEYLSAQFEEVGGYEFYAELFPDCVAVLFTVGEVISWNTLSA